MSYDRLNLKNGTDLDEKHLKHIEDGIVNAGNVVVTADWRTYTASHSASEIKQAFKNGRNVVLASFEDFVTNNPTMYSLYMVEENAVTFVNIEVHDTVYQELITIDDDRNFKKQSYILHPLVKSINGIEPDESGNVEITITDSAEEDIPKVFFGAALPQTKDDTIMTFRYISKTKDISGYCKTKAQGNSSMSYPKKNQTVKLYKDAECTETLEVDFKGWGKQNKFCFKANWVDHSHARNIFCANLWSEVVTSRVDYASLPEELRNSPNNGAIDGFPVKLYANGVYQGIYTLNIPKDAWMWNMDEENSNHVLLCGNQNTDVLDVTETSTNFRVLFSGTDGDGWDAEVGTLTDDITNSLNALISCVKDTDDETFKATIGNFLDVQSAIDYYLLVQVTGAIDNLGNNLLLATYDGIKWYCGAYDLDNTFLYASHSLPEDCTEKYNLLFERIEKLYPEELNARYVQLRESVFSYSNMITGLERFMDRIGTELYAEDLTVYPDIPADDSDTVSGLRKLIVTRLPLIDKEVEGWLNPDTPSYTEVEYIESDGTQWIDTGISGGSNAAYEIKMAACEGNSVNYGNFFGSAVNDAAPEIYYQSNGGVMTTLDCSDTWMWSASDTAARTVKYEATGTLTIDGSDIRATTGTSFPGRGWGDSTWNIFSGNEYGNYWQHTKMRLYYLKMYTDGVLVRDFVPVKRNEDGLYGLFDNISQTFFAGSGTFIGPAA